MNKKEINQLKNMIKKFERMEKEWKKSPKPETISDEKLRKNCEFWWKFCEDIPKLKNEMKQIIEKSNKIEDVK